MGSHGNFHLVDKVHDCTINERKNVNMPTMHCFATCRCTSEPIRQYMSMIVCSISLDCNWVRIVIGNKKRYGRLLNSLALVIITIKKEEPITPLAASLTPEQGHILRRPYFKQ